MKRRRPLSMLGAACLALTSTRSAHADDDGLYGRLEGDLTLSGEAGFAEAFPGEALVARASALYLSSVGLYGNYGDSLGRPVQPVARSLSGGIEVRPLFLARFARDMEYGGALADQLLDSLSLDLGIFHAWRPDPPVGAGDATGLELGVGIEMPLLPRASTPFVGLRLLGRIHTEAPDAPMTGVLQLTLGFRGVVQTGLVDPADPP